MIEPRPTRDHTERMLRAAGAARADRERRHPVTIRGELPAQRVTVEPAERLEPGESRSPATSPRPRSSRRRAARPAAARSGSSGVGLNPTRIGLLGILNRMGAAVEVIETAAAGARAGGDDRRPLRPAAGRPGSAAGEVPLAIDELPLVALAACFAEGETVVTGAEELRHKESDRIATVVDGLRGLGAEIEATEDGFAVAGTRRPARRRRSTPHGDHRLAMLGAIAGLASRDGVEVARLRGRRVSYPGFERDLAALLEPVSRAGSGCPSPGQGESTSSRRASSVARDLVALVGVELGQQAGAAADGLAAGLARSRPRPRRRRARRARGPGAR